MTRGVAILGSTGSIGTTALRVLDRQRDRFRVAALTAFANSALLGPAGRASSRRRSSGVSATERTGAGGEPASDCLVEAATRDDVDIVLNAVVGAAGLDATLAALEAGKRVALANKETLVVAGDLAAAAAKRGGGEIVPVDSEHSRDPAVHRRAGRRVDVRRVILTASGGPFRDWPPTASREQRVADALQHPTWRMGRKITVDSATLANKALEVIEAHYLFDLPYDRIEVIVHPQSIVHSFVEFVDGSVLAQMSVPTMELPVLYALTHPERVPDSGVRPFDPVACSPLTFEPVRYDQFPALAARDAGRACAAVRHLRSSTRRTSRPWHFFWTDASRSSTSRSAIDSALETLGDTASGSREALLAVDAEARRHVRRLFSC